MLGLDRSGLQNYIRFNRCIVLATSIKTILRPTFRPFLLEYNLVFGYNMLYFNSLCLHTAKMKLNEKYILNVLHEAEFADAHWELLGNKLIKHSALLTIRANRHYQANLCIMDTISQWLRSDTEASWEKLAAAVAKVEEYGEATANIVRQKAGIGKAKIPASWLATYASTVVVQKRRGGGWLDVVT